MGFVASSLNLKNESKSENENSQIEFVKKALLIGINYEGQDGELNGCINDSLNLKNFMIGQNYFDEHEFTLLNDKESDDMKPTRKNILEQFNQLVTFANSKENEDKKVCLFVSYSGHGSYKRDRNGDEVDGKDEMLCPVDYSTNGFITDDILKQKLVDTMPSNVSLFIMIDACHSGTICDLKYNYAVDKKLSYTVQGVTNPSTCQVTMISGCRDDQTSADAYIYDENDKHFEYQGAMSASFMANFKDDVNYQDLVNKMRIWLKVNKYTQVPQLSSGKYIDITKPCILSFFDN
jgi:hypothetical protein